MVKIINYLKGYVRIKVWGGAVERFVNLCGNKNLLIWEVTKSEDSYEMYISLDAFYELRTIARKTLTRVVILKRYGLPFLLPGLRKRIAFTICCFMAFAFLYGSSLFLWDIEYEGNMRLTNEVIGDFLANQGVHIGMYTKKLDIETLEKELRKNFTEITWVSLKLDGARLEVSLKENDAPIIEKESQAGMETGEDILAPYNGQILSIVVRKGVPCVVAGEVVEKGTILVEGKIPVMNEDGTVRENLYVVSDADVWMEHTIDYLEELPFCYQEKKYTGRVRMGYFVRYDKSEIASRKEGCFAVYDIVSKSYRAKILEKLDIPLYVGSMRYREYYNVEKKYTSQLAEKELNEKLEQFIISLEEKGVQIIEKDVKISSNEKCWILAGSITVIEKIESQSPALIENIDSGE